MKKKSSNTTSEEIFEEKRYRNFIVLFYKDTTSYKFDDIIFNIHGFKYYAYIKHQPEEEEKKEHYHCYIHLDSATTEKALAKRIGIPQHHVQYVKNCRGACRYLTHIDYEDKMQYSLSDVKVSAPFERKFKQCFEDVKTEEEIIQDIYFWLDNTHFDTFQEKLKYFTIFINYNCYDTIFKRYRWEFIEYMKVNL